MTVYTIEDIDLLRYNSEDTNCQVLSVKFKGNFTEYKYLWQGLLAETGDYVLISNQYYTISTATVVSATPIDNTSLADHKPVLGLISLSAGRRREALKKERLALEKKRKSILAELRAKLEDTAWIEYAKSEGIDTSELEAVSSKLAELK
jgi:hypothetical protein